MCFGETCREQTAHRFKVTRNYNLLKRFYPGISATYESFSYSTSSPTFGIISLILNILLCMQWQFIMALICIFLMANGEHLLSNVSHLDTFCEVLAVVLTM